jgi:hypothetical protein
MPSKILFATLSLILPDNEFKYSNLTNSSIFDNSIEGASVDIDFIWTIGVLPIVEVISSKIGGGEGRELDIYLNK